MKRLRPLAAVMFTMLLAACMDGTPTLQASPSASAVPQIVAFEVFPNPVERGDELRVTWQVDGASRAALWPMTYDSKLGRWYRQRDPISTGSTAGEYRLTVPPDADRTLRFELEATDTIGNSVTATSDEIRLVCHPIFFDLSRTAWCPNPPQTTLAAFQAFEGGYMIWRADTGQVYMLLQPAEPELPDGWFASVPTSKAVTVDAPPGRYAPGEHFQRAWASLTEHWRSLGWGVAPEQAFTLTAQLSLSSGDTMSQNDDLYLSWPDGRIAHLRVYLSAPNHASGPAWSFVDPNTVPAPAVDASAVPTPFPTVAAKAPTILSFTADRVNAKPGDRVTLSWTST
ncbi:MAG TPA: hypothetical protein VFL17_20225, partial [Anaerolineae bacterium]|nr:hypothetical protein [Anaerolineae bacterium]